MSAHLLPPRLIFPMLLLALWLLLAIFGTWLPLEPNHIELPHILAAPSLSQWLGYDELGRPVLDRMIMGAQTSFLVAFWVISVSLFVGTFIGVFSAWRGGVIDRIIVHIMDVFLAFPGILLAIALAGLLGPGIDNVVFALSAVGWIGFARLARAQTLSLKQREHVRAALAIGANEYRILRYHLIPLLLAPLIVEATFGVAGIVIAEAGLSFLGLGVQSPAASWGSMLRDGTRYMLMAPHLVLAPGLALMLVVLSVNLLGDWLRDWLDVKTRD
ncbi:ABC transporter permease [Candidatus Venteria ishoeyi]|uniref:Glutathione transport system permease protein GsiD n=1 Tax=Candidatus Venteria ishoeyi TaxID=1899563 RepID=A0A1H6FCU3_9GAMM|nr:ABC transporter permease [Candidatus Venteria ishoeyi]MDM8545100.1 ABC transporter permease [Candidatus Venteria ishoeyi]SEH07877.1 Glutathione transport system permease protein GsiD [Candidatus Venteria ishoeyi]